MNDAIGWIKNNFDKEEAIKQIEEKFEENEPPEDFLKELRGETDYDWESPESVRQTIADFLEEHLERGGLTTGINFKQTIDLTDEQKEKGKIEQDIGILLEIAITFGVLWQQQDIIDALKEAKND